MDFTCLPIDACYRHRETLQSILYRIISQNLSELGTLTSGLRGFIHEVEHLFIFGTKKQWRSTICPWCLWKKIKCPTAFISSASMQRKPRLTSWKLSHIFATFIRIRCISCMCIYIWTIIYTYIHTLHYITLHYITLHHITLHYITLHTYIHTYYVICTCIFNHICHMPRKSVTAPSWFRGWSDEVQGRPVIQNHENSLDLAWMTMNI